MQLQITISYCQLCVFDPALEAPYNDWSQVHTVQGFAWRPGSVSFATEDVQGASVVDVSWSEAAPDASDASSAIRVPFEVPASGTVEVGSIMSGAIVELPSGHYALYFLAPQTAVEPFRLVFVPDDSVEPCVVKDGPQARRQPSYLMVAEPA